MGGGGGYTSYPNRNPKLDTDTKVLGSLRPFHVVEVTACIMGYSKVIRQTGSVKGMHLQVGSKAPASIAAQHLAAHEGGGSYL